MSRFQVVHAEDDGNGFPGGVKISFAALNAVIGVLGLILVVTGIVNGLFLTQLKDIKESIRALDERACKRIEQTESRMGTLEQNIYNHVSQAH
jgi:hypothetical protein